MYKASYWIKKLQLKPHPEGGFYRRIYKSDKTFTIKSSLDRPLFTSIYYLLQSGSKSKFHQIKSDEIWYFHAGASIVLHMVSEEGEYNKVIIGNQEKNAHLQYLVKTGTIFGAEILEKESYSLLSCMVSPGFDFDDFKLFSTTDLIQKYPQYTNIIKQFT